MRVYYNENDPKACAWLRELMSAGLIPKGHVDERSIVDVRADDILGYQQCHFFAGIGGWPYSLELAGWTGPVWTASCPCQPFSAAGKRQGARDDRNLWPVLHGLISKLKPQRIFGEQVAQSIGFNWLDGVSSDLEADGYAVGAVVLGAHSVGAPHIRQRLFWVADAEHSVRRPQHIDGQNVINGSHNGRTEAHGQSGACCEVRGLADANNGQREQLQRTQWDDVQRPSDGGGLGNAYQPRLQERETDKQRTDQATEPVSPSPWRDSITIQCTDGKTRRISQSGIFPLVARLPGGMVPSSDPCVEEANSSSESRVARLKGYGNAITVQVAEAFIRSYMEI